MVIRPVEPRDLDALEHLSTGSGAGLTSLRTDRAGLSEMIEASQKSFATNVREPAGERYLFVLEDPSTGELVGCCGIKAGIGLTEPFYIYRLTNIVHASRSLKVYKQLPALFLCNDYTGCTELGSLYLTPAHRHGVNGKLLSKSRLLFMAEFTHRFSEQVIAELRGVSDEQGHAPFWEGLGKHFFAMDFTRADYLSAMGNNSFIAELMPRHPVYTLFLNEEAQATIGQVHEQTRPALAMLEREGFRQRGYVDIFDGGPTVECGLQDIRAIRDSRRARLKVSRLPEDAKPWLLASTSLQSFRCAVARAIAEDEQALLVDRQTCESLLLADGAPARGVPL